MGLPVFEELRDKPQDKPQDRRHVTFGGTEIVVFHNNNNKPQDSSRVLQTWGSEYCYQQKKLKSPDLRRKMFFYESTYIFGDFLNKHPEFVDQNKDSLEKFCMDIAGEGLEYCRKRRFIHVNACINDERTKSSEFFRELKDLADRQAKLLKHFHVTSFTLQQIEDMDNMYSILFGDDWVFAFNAQKIDLGFALLRFLRVLSKEHRVTHLAIALDFLRYCYDELCFDRFKERDFMMIELAIYLDSH